MAKKKMYTSTFTVDGHRYYVRSTVSQRDADRRAGVRKADIEAGRVVLGGNTTLADYAQLWVETYKKNMVSKGTYITYIGHLRNHILPACGDMPIRLIRPTHLQGILNRCPGYSGNFYSKLRNTLRQIFDQAVYDKMIADNPAARLTLPQGENGSHRSITEEERRATLAVAKRHPFGLFVKFLLYCGLRPQEAAGLRWGDFDQINHRVKIQRAVKKEGGIGETKSKAGLRDIPVPDVLWDELRPLFPKDLDGYVFPNPDGNYISHRTIYKRWESFRREIDLELGAQVYTDSNGAPVLRKGTPIIRESRIAYDLQLYCYRHTYCTDLEAAGVSLNVASYLMGHSNIQLTAKIYSHMRGDILEDAAEKINRASATLAEQAASASATKNPLKIVENPTKPDSKNDQIRNNTYSLKGYPYELLNFSELFAFLEKCSDFRERERAPCGSLSLSHSPSPSLWGGAANTQKSAQGQFLLPFAG